MTELVALRTTSGGRLHATPERITAVWEIATYTPPSNGRFPGMPEPTPAKGGFQTRVELGDGAGTFSVVETVDEVLERRAAALRRRPRRIFRRAREVAA
mgnify:CR=1 FL=1